MHNRTARIVISIGLVMAFAVAIADAQDRPVRVRGVIERVDGATYFVKAKEGNELKLVLADNAAVSAIVKASLADVKAGTYVGIASLPLADGTQKALEVLIFPEAARGTAEGHFPWDLQPTSVMTNGSVEVTVAAVEGQMLTVKYKDSQTKIVVPPDAPIVATAPGDKSELKPGAAIFVFAAKALPDGTLQAARISVGRGIAPPM